MDPSQLRDIALQAARIATAVHRRHLGELDVSEWAEKGTSDFVTRVDHDAEAAAIAHIRACCPDHDVLAEESARLGDAASIRDRFDAAEYLWVLDPLDGTTNYLHRYPAYAASLAVAHRGQIVAGAVVDGTTGTAWTAWKGGGAWMDDRRIAVSGVEQLRHALIGTGFPFKALHLLPRYLHQFDAVIRRTSGIRRAGAAALDLCHVAAGWLDGFWELWLAPWDIAAGALVIREAGGMISTLDGDDDIRAAGPILAGNPTIYWMLKDLLEADPGVMTATPPAPPDP